MSQLTIIAVILLTTSLCLAQEGCEREKMLQCTGCRTYNLCLPGQTEPSPDIRCAAEVPYCHTGESSDYCSVQKDPENDDCEEDGFACIGEPDKYPDPGNCRRFYYCFNADILKSQPEDCASTHYYNSLTRQCVRQSSTAQCWITDCSKGDTQIYKPDPQFYIVCANGVPLVHRCVTFETFDMSTGCHYTCKTEGNHQHSDKTKYYYCYKEGVTFKYEVRKCPVGEFDPVTKQCVFFDEM